MRACFDAAASASRRAKAGQVPGLEGPWLRPWVEGTPRCCSCERMEPRESRYVLLDYGPKLGLRCLDSAVMDTKQQKHGGDCIQDIAVNQLRGALKIAAIKAPGFGERKTQYLDEVAILMGATVIRDEVAAVLGTAAKAVLTKESTTIVGDGSTQEVTKRVAQIEYKKEKLKERIAKLAGGVAVIQVGAQTKTERKEKNLVQIEPVAAETVEVSPQYAEAKFNRDDQRARYRLPSLDKDGFRVSGLVWSKLKGHPWWAGEIFDPSNASELALKHQKKGYHLVAYCGDTTFAWCDVSQLKPFMTNHSQMEKQSSSDCFINSVNHALEELSRRIWSGMSCSCLLEELSDNGLPYMIENSGLREGVSCSTVKQAEILEYFSPENLLHHVKSLALSPGQGSDLLDLVIACSQLTSFNRSKGCPELASFQTGSAWVGSGMDTPPTKNVMLGEAVTVEVQPSHDKPKSGVLALRFLQLPWDPGGQTSMESAWGQAKFHRGKNVMNVGCRSWAVRLDNANGLATRPNRLDWHQYIGSK